MTWKRIEVRRLLLLGLGFYIVMRVWSGRRAMALRLVLIALGAGAALVIPSFYSLLRVFKGGPALRTTAQLASGSRKGG